MGGPQCRSGQLRKMSPPPGFDPLTAQPVANRYTNYAIWKLLNHYSWSGYGPARTLNIISVTADFCPLFQPPQECRIHIGKLIVPNPQLVRKFSAFYNTRISLLCSLQPIICLCHQPVEPNPHIFIFISELFYYFPHLYV